jgi:hypothetical protein
MKIIGVSVDNYKAKKYRERLKEKKFNIQSEIKINLKVTLFKIQCNEIDFESTKERLEKVLKQLEIEIKNLN